MDPWNQIWQDPVAGLRTTSSCMCLADLKADGQFSLIVADLKKKLRVYRGAQIAWESVLTQIPSAVQVFYSQAGSIPSLAVASGCYIYIYKNSRPFFKFTLPPVQLSQQELGLWQQARNNQINYQNMIYYLNQLRDNQIQLSSQSIQLLSYDSQQQKIQFIEKYKDNIIVQNTSINCLSIIKRDLDHDISTSMLCIGSEHKNVYILDQTGSSILMKQQLPGVPAQMTTIGQYCGEYRIIVACRDFNIYTIKNAQVMSNVIELQAAPVQIVCLQRSIYIATSDKKIHSYHLKGKKLFTLYMNDHILSMTQLKLSRERLFKGLLVGMANGEIKLFKDKVLLSTMNIGDRIQGMCFGIFGQQDGCLVVNIKSGGIVIKSIDSRANLEKKAQFSGPPKQQEIPLKVPKKSKLYIEQADRQRQIASQMYSGFLKDLTALRLRTAQAFLNTQNIDSSASSSQFSLKLNAYIQGLGPLFTIVLELKNTGKQICQDVWVNFHYNPSMVRVLKPGCAYSVLIPQVTYKTEIPVHNLSGGADELRVLLSKRNSSLPLVSALVSIPACENFYE